MEDPKLSIGKHINTLPSPAFVVNSSKMLKNCNNMREKYESLGIRLRPHVKTHKTLEGALIQTGGKRECIVVSTVAEAAFFIENGFDDIVLGRPVTGHLLQRCEKLLSNNRKLYFLVNGNDGVKEVLAASGKNGPLRVLLKISCGYERAGIPWDDTQLITSIARELHNARGVELEGLYAHCGDSYTADRARVLQVRDYTVERVLQVRDELVAAGLPCAQLGVGSTPSCSLPPSQQMRQLTEVHTGNYAFYDCQQESYGACNREDIAGRVLTRVVSHHPQRNQILVDLGFTALTKQGLDNAVPGYAAFDGHPNLKLCAMSQEFGKIETVDGSPIDYSAYPVDMPLFVFPYHACATAGVHQYYYIHNEAGIVSDVWYPVHGW